MQEQNGVRRGQPVRDLDGTSLGRVTRLFDWGFEARRTLSRRTSIVRYDELRGLRDGALVVARSRRDLFELAAGGVPPAWRIPAPPAFPTAATPSEARSVREDVAAGRVPGDGSAAGPEDVPPPPGAEAAPAPLTDEELRAFVDSRGESAAPRASSDRQ